MTKAPRVIVKEVMPGRWTVDTHKGYALIVSLKNKEAAQQIVDILNAQADADNIVWTEGFNT